jgi:cytidylate kinase
MIVALYGGTGCGKTTLARVAAGALDIPVRHCGNEIRDALEAAGSDAVLSADRIHRSVDEQTQRWCGQINGDALVDGRFLDQVLSGLPNIVFIEVVATEEVRVRRLAERLGRQVDGAEIRAADEEDDLFRRRMYSGASRAAGARMIDTSGGSARECGENLISLISQLRATAPG